jgi:PAS domain-containing protein
MTSNTAARDPRIYDLRRKKWRWSMLDSDFRKMLDVFPDGVLVERGDRIDYVNLAYARLLGYSSRSEAMRNAKRETRNEK